MNDLERIISAVNDMRAELRVSKQREQTAATILAALIQERAALHLPYPTAVLVLDAVKQADALRAELDRTK